MNWPWLRVEKFWESHQKRIIVDELKARKISMMNAIYANSNYDGQENQGVREKIVEGLESQFTDAVANLYRGPGPTQAEIEDKEMKENPFFQAMERGMERQGLPTYEESADDEFDQM